MSNNFLKSRSHLSNIVNIRLIKKKTQSVFRIKPHLVDCVVRIEKNFCFGFIYGLFVFMLTNGYDACEKSNQSFEAAKYISNMSKTPVAFIVWFELKRECVTNFKSTVAT